MRCAVRCSANRMNGDLHFVSEPLVRRTFLDVDDGVEFID